MNTGEVATLLGITEPRIQQLIRWRKIDPPPKCGGRRKWTTRDVERLREVLRRNS
jgi:DNA-binding transcriptional MerR regulator